MDFGSTSTWDDWLVTRSLTGDQYADGVARALLDHNALHQMDFGAEGTRKGLRNLFAEFEEATAGQVVRGRSIRLSPRAPDSYQITADQGRGTVKVHYGRPAEQGMFVEMDLPAATSFLRELLQAVEAIGDKA